MNLTTQGLHHVSLVTGDARRAVAFYRDLLGLDLLTRVFGSDDPGSGHLYFGDPTGTPGTLLTLFEQPGAARGRWGVGGLHHVALGVETAEAQLKWKRRLADAGVRVGGPYDRGYFKSIYFPDPDGHILEIATAGPGYAIDEPADALGQTVLIPETAELGGERDEEAIRLRTHPEPVPEVTPDMRLQGIHHVSGITDDIGRAHDFYTGALGLRRIKQSVNQDHQKTPHHFWARYENGLVAPSSSYTLFGWEGSDYRARLGRGQTHHVAFRAKDVDEQLAWREQLRSLGLDVSPVEDLGFFKTVYFRAPDGMLLGISTDGPGFAVDEAASETDGPATAPLG